MSAPARAAVPVAPDPLTASSRPVLIGQVERFLEALIPQLEPAAAAGAPRGGGRPRVLPACCLWAGLLVCVLRGLGSQLALWRLLSLHGLWHYPRFPVSDQAVYARLADAGPAPLARLFAAVTALLAERLAPYADHTLAPWAADVVALDERRPSTRCRASCPPSPGRRRARPRCRAG